MADVFMIETDEVSSVQSQVSNIASSITETAGTVRGWSTDACESGFHFDKAKSALAKYLDACAKRVTNTSKALSDVVSKHTELQNSLAKGSLPAAEKPEEAEEPTEEQAPTEEPSATPTAPATSTPSESTPTQNQNIVMPTPAIPSPGKGDDKTKPSSKPSQPKEKEEKKEETKQPVTPPEKQPEEKKEEKQPTETEQPKDNSSDKENNPSTPAEDTEKTTDDTSSYVEEVSYAAPKQDQLSDESKRIINDVATVGDDGYSRIDDKYVVACDPSVGKVGDNIKITTESGETVDCVVGVNTNTDSNKNKMYFIVDENKSSIQPLDVSNKINSSSKVDNLGAYPALSASSTANITSNNVTSNVEDTIDEDNNSSSEGDDTNG